MEDEYKGMKEGGRTHEGKEISAKRRAQWKTKGKENQYTMTKNGRGKADHECKKKKTRKWDDKEEGKWKKR